MLSSALSKKKTKALRFFVAAKLEGHRSEIKPLCKCLKIQPKTCQRLVKKVVADGWAGSDGVFLFPRSWRNLHYSNGGGLYLTAPGSLRILKDLKRFEALCFAKALKRFYQQKRKNKKLNRKQWSPHSSTRRILQRDFPARYLCKSLGLSERRFERLKANAAKYKFIRVKQQEFDLIGKADELQVWKKNYPDRTFFQTKGGYCYTPEVSRIRVLL